MNETHTGNKVKLPEAVVLLDSLGDLQSSNSSPILVCGSHCGGNQSLADHVANCHVKAVFLNCAGVGKNDAGIKGLTHYEVANVLACAVDHYSAEIGIAADTFENGVISHLSKRAAIAGIEVGDSVKAAIEKLADPALLSSSGLDLEPSRKEEENPSSLKQQSSVEIEGTSVTVTDSITFLNEKNAGDIVICGSHGGMSAGKYAKKHGVKAVFFNDAGIGRNDAGIKSLEFLNDAGILACTVDCMSAEIFNGKDTLENGIISVCNQLAKSRGIQEKLSVKEAIKLL